MISKIRKNFNKTQKGNISEEFLVNFIKTHQLLIENVRNIKNKKIKFCEICKNQFESGQKLSQHLKKEHNISSIDYYNIFYKDYEHEGSCIICNNPTKYFNHVIGYRNTCSKKCKNLVISESVKSAYKREEVKLNHKIGQERAKLTNLKKCGYEYASQSRECKKKISDTLKNKTKEEKEAINNKRIITLKKTHNCINPSHTINWTEERKNRTFINRLNHIKSENKFNIIWINDVKTLFILECRECKKLKISEHLHAKHIDLTRCLACFPKYESKNEIELRDYIISLGINIEHQNRKIISPEEIDVYCPDQKIGFEYHGVWCHSEIFKKAQGKNSNYHLDKYNKSKNVGVHLIQIFSSEWIHKQDIIKSIISAKLNKSKRICTARQTVIKEISASDKNKFLNDNHLQGADQSTYKLGAFYKDILVSVLTLRKPNIAKGKQKENNLYELSRFASMKFGYVTGIFSKFISYIKRELSDDVHKIYTYADKRYSNGDVYRNSGFTELTDTKPNYWYWQTNNDSVLFYRYHFRKSTLSDKLDIFDPNLTEIENMNMNGYDRIFDCGHKKFELQII